jgi:two-component system chemotaxis response regulator CheY
VRVYINVASVVNANAAFTGGGMHPPSRFGRDSLYVTVSVAGTCSACLLTAKSAIGCRFTVSRVFPDALRWKTIMGGSCPRVKSLVMIVDDHAVIRRVLRVAFEAEDLEVSDAVDGADGVRKAQELNPSLIILDLSMPVMNGLEAARALKLLMPDVPLLMFTNNSGAGIENEARSAGISAVVCKSDSNSSQQLVAHARRLLGLETGQALGEFS